MGVINIRHGLYNRMYVFLHYPRKVLSIVYLIFPRGSSKYEVYYLSNYSDISFSFLCLEEVQANANLSTKDTVFFTI